MAAPERHRLVPLYSRRQIDRVVRGLARRIERDYRGRDVVMVAVLKGAFVFAADLVRALKLPVSIDFVGMSSYGVRRTTSGRVRITCPLRLDIAGKDVLVIEDILDTGLTLSALVRHLARRGAASVRICALIDKRERRTAPLQADYVGFRLAAGFVAGYGIDYAERYRSLPDIRLVQFLPSPTRLSHTMLDKARRVALTDRDGRGAPSPGRGRNHRGVTMETPPGSSGAPSGRKPRGRAQ